MKTEVRFSPADLPMTRDRKCVGMCRLDPKREFCTGCYRTVAEIIEAGRAAKEQRKIR